MKNKQILIAGCMVCLHLLPSAILAQSPPKEKNAFQRAARHITYCGEAQSSWTSTYSPLWLNANRHGLSSVEGNNGYLRLGLFRDTGSDSLSRWRLGYGVDVATAYHFTSTFLLQQLYADLEYQKLRLSVGCKEHPMALKHQRLSSGSQLFGINARPIPEARLEIHDYLSLTGKSNWVGIRGHVGYGWMTDGDWREKQLTPGQTYVKGVLYHSKSCYLRLGNEAKFPLVFEGGFEMASLFGGDVHTQSGHVLKGHVKLEDFFKMFICSSNSSVTEEDFLGDWLLSLSYKGKDWKVRAYYDHFCEDHSMMFFDYGWFDGLIGAEITLPPNPYLHALVYEFINTTYQSGPVYHASTTAVPDQIGGIDKYYYHHTYPGWQHWGQAIGNPLYHSPLYYHDGKMNFNGSRFRAHHVGIEGQPLKGVDYRLLYTYMSNWGTYMEPYLDKKYCTSLLAEVGYAFPRFKHLNLEGWSVRAAFALDRGKEIGDHTGLQLTLRKTGVLTP